MVDKITLSNVTTFQNDGTAVAAVNNNNAAIITAMNNTLSRDGTGPNQMGANLDMNNNNIINLPPPITINSPARLVDVATNPTIVVPPTGTSGHNVPFLDGNNTWSGTNTYNGTGSFTNTNNFSNTTSFQNDITVSGSGGVKVTGTGGFQHNAASGGAFVFINPQTASQQAVVNYAQGGATKWQIGKNTDDSFFLFDTVGGRNVLTTAANTGLNILGTRTNDNAVAGFVGEFSLITAGSVSLVANTPKTVVTASIPAGDWELSGTAAIVPAGTTTVGQIAACFSLTTNALNPIENNNFLNISIPFTTGQNQSIAIPNNRVSLSATTNIFLVLQISFGVSTCTGGGFIRARRCR